MKFISFIASMVLIVLISQHSIMGLPLNDTVVEGSCSEGFEMINGQCMPIKSTLNSTEIETTSTLSETTTIDEEPPVTKLNLPKRIGRCSKGMQHGEHGICEPIQLMTSTIETETETVSNLLETTTILEEVPVTKLNVPKRIGRCPKGMQHGEHGICEPIQLMTSTIETENETETVSNLLETTTLLEEPPVTELNVPKTTGRCSKGMKLGENRICVLIQSSTTTEATDELTTDLNENVGGVENPKGCPNGTEPDEQGYCQSIKPSNSTTLITDPKILLNKDGSCPDNYKMVEGQCLYIKLETNATLYSGDLIVNIITDDIQPKSGIGESSKIELVPVLSDNSCPEGTVYSSYGLCQKRTRPSTANILMKSDGSCPDDFELVNGKCVHKNPETLVQTGLPTTTIRMFQNTTLAQESLNNTELIQSTTISGKLAHKSHFESTTSSVVN